MHGEQPLLVAGVADEQVDVPAGAGGQRLPRRGRQDVAVDDGRERDRPVRGLAPASPPTGHLGADRVASGGQPRPGRRADRSATVGRSPSSAAQAAAMSAASSGEKNVPGTLCATARRKSPAARGIASSAATDPPPADSPKTVTRSGSPPKAAMLSRTHSRAATWSSRPRLAGAPSICAKPSTPTR